MGSRRMKKRELNVHSKDSVMVAMRAHPQVFFKIDFAAAEMTDEKKDMLIRCLAPRMYFHTACIHIHTCINMHARTYMHY